MATTVVGAQASRAVLADPILIDQIVTQRKKLGIDRRDELWDGVWHMPPNPTLEHQRTEGNLLVVLKEVVDQGGLGEAFGEVNVADPVRGMADFRVPDAVVVLKGSAATLHDVYIAGGPDFVVEIRSPGDETYEKIPWYASQGVRELLVLERDSKAFILHRLLGGRLEPVPASPEGIASEVLPLRFQTVDQDGRGRLRVVHIQDASRVWLV